MTNTDKVKENFLTNRFIQVVSIGIIILIMATLLVGCANDSDSDEKQLSFSIEDRFVRIGYERNVTTSNYFIYVDKETRVMYWGMSSSYASALSPILNPDGTPELYDGDL